MLEKKNWSRNSFRISLVSETERSHLCSDDDDYYWCLKRWTLWNCLLISLPKFEDAFCDWHEDSQARDKLKKNKGNKQWRKRQRVRIKSSVELIVSSLVSLQQDPKWIWNYLVYFIFFAIPDSVCASLSSRLRSQTDGRIVSQTRFTGYCSWSSGVINNLSRI